MENNLSELKVEFDTASRILEKMPRYTIIVGVCYHNPLKQRKCNIKIAQKDWVWILKKNWKKVNVTQFEYVDSTKIKGKVSIPLFQSFAYEKLSFLNMAYTDDGY